MWAVIAFLLVNIPIHAQDFSAQLLKEIPLDNQVIKGKLANGLTYYIRQNAKPENKIEFRLVINAGSVLEDDDQQGLAHFCEHMCFNGTKHFQRNELVSYLQSIGVEFGNDLNAYTSFDETVYMLPVPTDNPENVDKGLLVLRDWANDVLFTGEEIDKERGVILEELRLGQGAQQRMRDEYFPILFKDSRYAQRLPIGKKHLLETFEYETIRRFYREWYRPDNMAVIAIGDLNPQEMKAKIAAKFGDIQMPEKYRERKEYQVPDHQDTYVSIVSDHEAQYTVIELMYKDDSEKTQIWNDYKRDLAQNIYSGMISARLNELTKSATPPFLFANSGYGSLVRTKNAYTSFAVVGPDGIEKALKTLLLENQRVKLHGFTQSELDRYKKQYLTGLEKQYNERDKTESKNYVSEYINNFLEQEPSPGIEAEYEFTKNALPGIKLDEVNALADKFIKDFNRVVVIMAPEKKGVKLPTEEDVKTWLKDADNEKLDAYVDETSSRPLMENIPSAGAIASEKTYDKSNVHEIVFENGLKVVMKPTNFKNDEILVSAYALGGTSLYNDEEFKSAGMAANLVNESGVNGFSKIALQKKLADKNLRVYPFISSLKEGFGGNSTPKDLETLLQLINLYFTAPNFNEDAFHSIINKQKMYLPNLLKEPTTYFRDQVARILANNSPRGNYIPSMEDLDELNFNVAKKAYQERFANAGDFTFFFVGNLDMDRDLPLLQKYLGSLKGKPSQSTYKDLGIRPPKGKLEKVVNKGEAEKSMVSIYYTGEAKYSDQDKYLLSALGEVLTIKLLENLREEKSGVYGVGARGSMSQRPYDNYSFKIGFPCGPKNVDKLIAAAYDEVNALKENGPTQVDVDKVKETEKINLEENLKQNRFWMNSIQSAYLNENNVEDILNKQEQIDQLNVKSLKKVANKYLKENALIQIVLMPDEKK
jgi:zinc protease